MSALIQAIVSDAATWLQPGPNPYTLGSRVWTDYTLQIDRACLWYSVGAMEGDVVIKARLDLTDAQGFIQEDMDIACRIETLEAWEEFKKHVIPAIVQRAQTASAN